MESCARADLKSCHESKRLKVNLKYTPKQPNVSGKILLGLLAALTLAAAASSNWSRIRARWVAITRTAVNEVDVEDENADRSFVISENGDGTAMVRILGTYTDRRTGDHLGFSAYDSATTNYSVWTDIRLNRSTNPDPGSGIASATVKGTLTDWKTGCTTPAVFQMALAVDNTKQVSEIVNRAFLRDPSEKPLTRVNHIGSRFYCLTNASYIFLVDGKLMLERTGNFGSVSVFHRTPW